MTSKVEQSQASHPAALRRELRSGLLQPVELTLNKNTHHPTELVSATIRITSTPKAVWSNRQKVALQTLKHAMLAWPEECEKAAPTFLDRPRSLLDLHMPPRRQDLAPEVHLPGPDVPSAEFMQRLIAAINELFFSGHLGTPPFEWDETLNHRRNAVGTCHSNFLTRESRIIMDQNWCGYPFDGQRRAEEILGILLHECAHAWMFKYSCTDSKSLCPKVHCRANQLEHTGLTGYGSAWIQLSTHIETVAREHIGTQVNLGVRRSFEHEQRVQLQRLEH